MLNKSSSIAVVGAGAIGGITAALLGKEGWDVEVVCRRGEIADRINSSGLHVFGLKGDHTVRLDAVKDIADLSGPKDVVILATKANDCVDAARELLSFLHPDSSVVSLQNGICEPLLEEVLGKARVVGCVTGWSATMHGPAELELTADGEFILGYIDRPADERLEFVRDTLGAVVSTRISENMMGDLYSKLVMNACINSLVAITGMNLNTLFVAKKARDIFINIMREAMAVADALGIEVEPGGGGALNFYELLEGEGPDAEKKRHTITRIVGLRSSKIKVSSLQSLERGRATEVDYLNGYICDRGREHDVPTPWNEAIVAITKEVESGKKKKTIENINDALFERLYT